MIVLIVAVCVASVWTVSTVRSRRLATPSAMLKRIPARDAVLLYIDFDALRRAGILQQLTGSKVPEEPEYQEFVRRTEFNYKEDLDTALISFAPAAKYLILRGRFDWSRLRSYVKEQAGSCYNTVCQLTGSTPERKISFFPLHTRLMAMAVGKSPDAYQDFGPPFPEQRPIDVPSEPVWISLPPSLLRKSDTFPSGTRMFAKSMEDAESVTLALGSARQDFEAKLNVLCRSEQDAALLQNQLERSTLLLRDMIAREKREPNPRDLSGVLTAGSFRRQGRRVFGQWPIRQAFIDETLAGGAR